MSLTVLHVCSICTCIDHAYLGMPYVLFQLRMLELVIEDIRMMSSTSFKRVKFIKSPF